jgi:hypothetical protein
VLEELVKINTAKLIIFTEVDQFLFLRIHLSADDWHPADPVGGHLEGAGPVAGRLLSPHTCLSLSSSRVSGEFIRFSLKGQAQGKKDFLEGSQSENFHVLSLCVLLVF